MAVIVLSILTPWSDYKTFSDLQLLQFVYFMKDQRQGGHILQEHTRKVTQELRCPNVITDLHNKQARERK